MPRAPTQHGGYRHGILETPVSTGTTVRLRALRATMPLLLLNI